MRSLAFLFAVALFPQPGGVGQAESRTPANLTYVGSSEGARTPAAPENSACRGEIGKIAAIAVDIKISLETQSQPHRGDIIVLRYSGLEKADHLQIVTAVSGPAEPVSGDFLTWTDKGKALDVVYPNKGAVAFGSDRLRASFIPYPPNTALTDASQIMRLRALAPGTVRLETAIFASTKCGQMMVGEIETREAIVTKDAVEEALATVAPTECETEKTVLAGFASRLKLSVDERRAVKAGDKFSVAWSGAPRFPTDRPTYLVLTLPDWVRFEGAGFMAIPGGTHEAGGLDYGAATTRVIVPLSNASASLDGRVDIKAYRAGALILGAKVIAKTGCGEIAIADFPDFDFEIAPGPSRVVIQDFFSLDQPEKVVISNDGRYRLEVFSSSYRVLDMKSARKIVERSGRNPNFSPTARFVAAYVEGNDQIGGRMELVDLMKEGVVDDVSLNGPTIAWALGDGLLIDGTMGHPEVHIRWALVDPTFEPTKEGQDRGDERGLISDGVSGRGTAAWERFDIRLLLERSAIELRRMDYPDPAPWSDGIYDLGGAAPIAAGGLNSVADMKRALLGLAPDARPHGWYGADALALSHSSRSVDDNLDSLEKESQDFRVHKWPRRARQSELLVRHEVQQTSAITTLASIDAIARGDADWRTMVRARAVDTTGAIARGQFSAQLSNRLASYGGCEEDDCISGRTVEAPRSFVRKSDFRQWSYQYGSMTTDFTSQPADLEKLIVSDIPAAKDHIRGKPNRVCYQWDDTKPANADGTRDPRDEGETWFRIISDRSGNTDVMGLWRWDTGDAKIWLVQLVCSHAGILNSPVLMFVGVPGQHGAMYSLGGGPQDPDLLNKDWVSGQNDEALKIRPFIVSDRWLILAAPAGNAAALIDLAKPAQPVITIVNGLKDVFASSQIMRAYKGQRLVQRNRNGEFRIYDLVEKSTIFDDARGKATNAEAVQVVAGRWIDDEIVFVTPRGYYDGSYEGAQFVHLTFVGERDLYSLAQFEKALKRPDVIRSILNGAASDGPPVTPDVPPEIELSLDTDGKVHVKASSQAGLKALRLFEDGEPVWQQIATGKSIDALASFDRQLTGRVLTAAAEDRNGFVSAPRQLALPARPSTRTLRAVVVGVGRHSNPALNLAYARSDAQRLAEALRQSAGKYYSQTQVEQSLDDDAAPDTIVSRVDRAVSEAQPGDVVLLYFAGHGVTGHDGKLYLAAGGFDDANVEKTGLAWARLRESLTRSRVRVLVVLDACHSGLTGAEGLTTNDAAADELIKGASAPILVLAASKGRQLSYEDDVAHPRWGGGVFTYALIQALTGDRAKVDANGDGALEISELYGAVKASVATQTDGKQTPWIVRQDLLGDFPVF